MNNRLTRLFSNKKALSFANNDTLSFSDKDALPFASNDTLSFSDKDALPLASNDTPAFSPKKKLLSVFFTAGYPELDQTLMIAKSLERAGVDFIEIGIPFSDPLADGPVIQQSSAQALKNGMTLSLLFEQLKNIRKEVQIPLILMGYINPILQYGFDRFCAACEEVGVDGLIVPDLPLDEYENIYQELFIKHHLSAIFLVSPMTSEKRIRRIDRLSTSFMYVLSSSTTTGTHMKTGISQESYFSRLKSMQLEHPLMVGFGIDSNKTFQDACKYASGAIVGTAFIRAMNEGKNIEEWVKELGQSLPS